MKPKLTCPVNNSPTYTPASPALVPHALFQTDTLPAAERFATWRESVLPLFDSFPDLMETPEAFSAQVESFNLGSMFFGTSSFSGLRFRRDKKHRADEGADHLLVQLYLSGGYQGHNGYRDVRVNPGDISFLDLGQVLETRAKPSNALSLVIPRDLLFSFAGSHELAYGTVISAASPMGNILSSHLLNVWRNLPSASVAELEMINRTLLGAVLGAFARGRNACEEHAGVMEGVTLGAIRTYIRRNLESQTLTPDHLCRHFGCSRAQLYRMFAPLGGVSSYIRDARLDRCLEQLVRSDGGSQKIIDVALRWGFSSHSHFCRLFKQTFGISPSDALDRGHTQASVLAGREYTLGHDNRPEFHDWLRHL